MFQSRHLLHPERHQTVDRFEPVLDAKTTGLLPGTIIATDKGWIGVESVTAGQHVLTFDQGLQKVVSVTRHVLVTDRSDPASWPIALPPGALGNEDAMTILPHQSFLIESDLAERALGDPFVLVRGAMKRGENGIEPVRPGSQIEVFQLHFARDEIIFANVGMLFLCSARPDLTELPQDHGYEVFTDQRFQILRAQVDAEEEQRAK